MGRQPKAAAVPRAVKIAVAVPVIDRIRELQEARERELGRQVTYSEIIEGLLPAKDGAR